MISPSSPNNPSWVTNQGMTLRFTPTLISHVGSYTLQYYLNETGVGICTFIPIIRELTLTVNKLPPQLNYLVPNRTDLRAGVAYEVVFGDYPCTDPNNDTITYNLLNSNNGAVDSYFTLDMSHKRIYGLVPNGVAGTYGFNLR